MEVESADCGVTSRSVAWKWIANQVTGHLPDPRRKHAELAGNIGATFSMIFAEYSLFALPQMASDLFDLWGSARLRRVEFSLTFSAPA